jgi:hypothetical protein
LGIQSSFCFGARNNQRHASAQNGSQHDLPNPALLTLGEVGVKPFADSHV